MLVSTFPLMVFYEQGFVDVSIALTNHWRRVFPQFQYIFPYLGEVIGNSIAVRYHYDYEGMSDRSTLMNEIQTYRQVQYLRNTVYCELAEVLYHPDRLTKTTAGDSEWGFVEP